MGNNAAEGCYSQRPNKNQTPNIYEQNIEIKIQINEIKSPFNTVWISDFDLEFQSL